MTMQQGNTVQQMVDIVFLVLLVLHVTTIVAWMGGAALFVSVVAPSLRKMSTASRNEFAVSTFPAYLRFISGSSIASVVVGLILYGYVTQVATALAPSGSGLISISIGAGLSLVALIIAFGIIMPTGRKLIAMAKQAQGGNMDTQMAGLQKRLTMAGRLGVALLGVTLILMVLGAEI